MKIIFENWRHYLNEAPEEPTVGEFLELFAKQRPKVLTKYLKIGAKAIGAVAGGLLTGAGAGAVTGGLGVAAAGAGAAVGAKIGEEALNQILGKIIDNAPNLANFLYTMAKQQIPDDQRKPIDVYFDLDDEYEALLQGMDSKLAKNFTKGLFEYYKDAFSQIEEEDMGKPLKNFLEMNANQYLRNFLSKQDRSGVGVIVKKI